MYDPTVADAYLTFGQIFRRSAGLFVSLDMTGRIAAVLGNWPVSQVDFICVSTGGRILGLGSGSKPLVIGPPPEAFVVR